jgi:predicted KAP-like P-loop ATPase
MIKIENFTDDQLGLEDFATRLEKFITIEHEYVEGSLVIALSSSFGSGKSTFLNMWQHSLENRKGNSNIPLVINLNAWESDYYGDPLFAIISALIDKVKKEGRSAETLISAAKDFGWFATAIGNQIAAKVTGIDAIAAGEFAETKKDARDVLVHRTF